MTNVGPLKYTTSRSTTHMYNITPFQAATRTRLHLLPARGQRHLPRLQLLHQLCHLLLRQRGVQGRALRFG